MEFLKKFKDQVVEFFSEVDSGTKLLAVLLGIVLFLSLCIAVYMNRKSDFSILFADLPEAEAAKIVPVLEDNNIAFKLKNSGRNIYVEEPALNRARLLLRDKGLPKDSQSVGFEIFDKTKLGVTDFVQNIQHNRALAGELERTIIAIQGIDSARVHIVMPEDKLFEKDKQEPTATIMLNLRMEGILDPSKITAIRQLTASSVVGLKPVNITVVDNFGNVLAAPQEDDSVASGAATRMAMQKNIESYYTRKVQTLLDSVVGRRNSVVRVDAALDFDRIEETEEKFNPESAVVRQETITSESNKGSSSQAKGPPGVQSNMNPKNTSSNSNSQQNSSNREVINNTYEIDKTVRHIIRGVGNVKKISISVFLKEEQAGEGEEKKNRDLKVFEDIVKNAIGFDNQRGDQLVIKEIPFNQKPLDIPKGSILDSDVGRFIGPAFKFLTLFSMLGVLLWLLGKKQKQEQVLVVKKEDLLEDTQKAQTGGVEEGLDEYQLEALSRVEAGSFVEAEVNSLVDKFPVESATIFKQWLVRDKKVVE